MLEVVILAAGKGTRMRSEKPKVLHHLAGKPFVSHVLDRALELNTHNIHLVVGHGADTVKATLTDYSPNYIAQEQQLGTGHAVSQALEFLDDNSTVLILYGDVPLIRNETLLQLSNLVSSEAMGLLTVSMSSPKGYGRIVRDDANQVIAIVEEKDANDKQRLIREVNTGVMAVASKDLKRWLPELSNHNAQEEYYLTDIIAMAARDNIVVKTVHPHDENEVLGINNRVQQAQVERLYQRDVANKLMELGVTLIDPNRIDCRGTLQVGNDCLIDVNCVFEGKVVLGNNVSIEANCIIKDTVIADNSRILPHSIVDGATIGQACNIGPFARLRPGTHLFDKAKIGNFVETKNTSVGVGSKINHFSYVGDSSLGRDVNIGAGTITCNYDGANKHKTLIEDDVFIGSNSALVAPLTIKSGSTVAAGSTITKNVEPNELSVARSRQTSITGWQRPVKKK